MQIAVTGANGFVGSALVNQFRQAGHHVREWVRQPLESGQYRFELADRQNIPPLSDVEVLVHAAYMPYSNKNKNAFAINVQMTETLAQQCAKYATKLVFISSLSAHEAATSVYGTQKLHCEKIVLKHNGLVIRPGLVIGEGGLFSRIKKTLRSAPIIPLIDGGKQPVQIVAVEELTHAIQRAIEINATGILTIATEKAYTLHEFYTIIAKSVKSDPWFIPVPFNLVYAMLWLSEKLGVPVSAGTDNLEGLRTNVVHSTKESLEVLNLKLRTLEELTKTDV